MFGVTVFTAECGIYQEAGVVYSERHVVRLLHAWGFERIRPRKEHLQSDETEHIEGLKTYHKR